MRTRIRYALKICSDAADWSTTAYPRNGYAPSDHDPLLINPDGTYGPDTLANMVNVFDDPPRRVEPAARGRRSRKP
jgi:hypothetical protein